MWQTAVGAFVGAMVLGKLGAAIGAAAGFHMWGKNAPEPVSGCVSCAGTDELLEPIEKQIDERNFITGGEKYVRGGTR